MSSKTKRKCNNCKEVIEEHHNRLHCYNCSSSGCEKCYEMVCNDCSVNMCKECSYDSEINCGCYGNCFKCGKEICKKGSGYECGECGKWYCDKKACHITNKCKECKIE